MNYEIVALPNGHIVNVGGGTLRILDINTGYIKMINGCTLWQCALLPNDYVVGHDGKTLSLWDINAGICIKVLEHPCPVSSLAVLPNGNVVSGGKDGTLRIWDINSGSCVKVINAHKLEVFCLVVLPNGYVLSKGYEYIFRVWDINSGQCIKEFSSDMYVISAAVLPNGYVVSGSYDGVIGVWDINYGICLKQLKGHTDQVLGVAGLSNGQTVSVSLDHTIKVWTPFPRLSYEMIAPVLTAITPSTMLNRLSCQGIQLGQAGYEHVLSLAQTIPSLKVIDVSNTGLTVNQATEIQQVLQEKKQRQEHQAPAQIIQEAISHYSAGRYAEAVVGCTQGLTSDTNNLLLLKLKALSHYQQGQYAQALTQFGSLDGGNGALWVAISRWRQGETEIVRILSLQDVNTFITAFPQKAMAYVVRGHLFLASNELDKAEMDFILFTEKLADPNRCDVDEYERGILMQLYQEGISQLASKRAAARPASPQPVQLESQLSISHEEVTQGQAIGRGGCGTVYKAIWQNAPVALKELNIHQLNPEDLANFQNEASIMTPLRHPRIVPLFGATFTPPYWLVLELMSKGALGTFLHSLEEIDWPLRIHFAQQIIEGLVYLHSKNIIHQDLKSMNMGLRVHPP